MIKTKKTTEEVLSPLVKFVSHSIDVSSKTQREICLEVGYDKPNLITMWKKGHTPIPLNKIPLLATSLGVDIKKLMTLALQTYYPDVAGVIENIYGGGVTKNEFDLINGLRKATNSNDPKFSRKAIDDLAHSDK